MFECTQVCDKTFERIDGKKNGEKRGASPHFGQSGMQLLLGGGNDVLRSLGYAELDDGLGLDLDGFTGLGVAANAGLALSLHQAADAGDDEDAVLLGFLDGGLGEQVKEGRGLFVGEFELLCQVPGKSCLGKSSCHVMFSF